jgi:squalene synthase HpnC
MANLKSDINAESGYHQAGKIVKAHYENFPVASILLPAGIRKHIAVVYWFARTADDFADEGNFSVNQRLEKLQGLENRFRSLLNNQCINHLECALQNTINTKKINPKYFFNLLKAFKQDVTKNRYEDFDEVLDYCSNSANPVGRIILELFKIRNERAFYFSDKICTALQLTNFIQDTLFDFRKGRIYYPKDEIEKFGVTEKMFEMSKNNLNLKQLVEFSVDRVQFLFNEGKCLLEFLSGKFRYEIDWTIRGGEEILNKIRGADFDVFTERPVLTKTDYLKLLFKSLVRL